MRISITVVESDVELSSDFLNLDVHADMTLNDVKAFVEAEINAPPEAQHFIQDGQPIPDPLKTLAELNIKEGDLLALAVTSQSQQGDRRRRTPQESSQGQAPQRPQADFDPERVRLHMLGDARFMQGVRQSNPRLAEAANDRNRFHTLFQEEQRRMGAEQREKERQYALLEQDPFNVEAQTKIEEMIRQERIAENLQKAMEENPESFGRVIMLYINVTVNNVPIKAFVDSGAQTTIMSPDAAERCSITHLIDKRWGGIARGVGTATILGRVHSADIQIGQYNLASSFTVMEGKDVDLLLGLDMLKRHQMCIDLNENCLRVQSDKIPFLAEHEIPKMMDEILEKEPKVAGPGGSTIGATTGTVEPAGITSSKAPQSAQASTTSSSAMASSSTQPAPRPAAQQTPSAFGQPQAITPQSIAQITELGFTREEAIAALRQVDGNVELAIGLLL